MDASGTVFIADTGNDRVRAVTASGTLVAMWGGFGSGDGRVSSPRGVAIGPDGRVYVADTGNDRIEVFEKNGGFVSAIGGSGSGPGRFFAPMGVALDAAGDIYVMDTGNSRVQELDPNGAPVRSWGSNGSGEGQFDGASGIAVASDGSVAVADTNNHRMQLFGPDGAFVRAWGWTWGSPSWSRYLTPSGVTAMPDGTLWIADTGHSRVEHCDLLGNRLWDVPAMPAEYGDAWTPSGSADGQFYAPRGVAAGADGTLYVADSGNNRIARRSPAGAWLPAWQAASSAPGRLAQPQAAAVRGDGATFIADTGNSRVERFDASGAFVGSIASSGTGAGQVSAPAGVAIAPDGSLLVADTGNGRIARFSDTGTSLGTFGAGALSSPSGIVADAAGVTYVADTGHNRIAVFDGNGVLQRTIDSSGAPGGPLRAPRGVALDTRGKLYVADTGNDRVVKFDTVTGAYATSFGSHGSAAGYFFAPTGVAVDSTGLVYVADSRNDRVEMFDASLGYVGALDANSSVRGPFHRPTGVTLAGDAPFVVESDGCRGQLFARDSEAPLTTASGAPSSATQDPIAISLDATDLASGVESTWYRVGAGHIVRYSAPIALDTEGTATVAYWSVDRAGNTEEPHSVTCVIDRTPPSGTFVVAGGSAFVNTTTVEISSAVAGASQLRTGYDSIRGDWRAYASSASVVLPDADGVYGVAADYQDDAGNTLGLRTAVRLDRVAPQISGLASPTHPLGETVHNVRQAEFDWSPPTDASPIAGYSWVFDAAENTTPTEHVNATSTRVTVDGLSSGTWYFHVRALDAAGNWGPAATVPITAVIDPVPPVGTMTVAGGSTWTSATAVPVASSVTDVQEMRVGVDGTWGAWGAYAETTTTALPDVEGTHTITAEYRNATLGVLSRSADVALDHTAPAIADLASPTHPLGVPVHGGTTATFTWSTPTDPSGVVGYSWAFDSATGTVPPAVINVTSPTVSVSGLGAGTYQFHVRAVDGAGNWGPASTVAIIVVVDPPVPSGYLVLEGFAPTVNHRDVWVASVVSDAEEMRIGVDGDWGAWSAYADTTQTLLPDADGTHTVGVQYRNYSGVLELSGDIALDREGPLVTGLFSPTHPLGVPMPNAPDARFQWDPSTDPSGVTGYAWCLDQQPDSVPDGTNYSMDCSATVEGLPSGRSYFHVRAVDGLGNWGPVVSLPVEVGPQGWMRVAGGASRVNTQTVEIFSAIQGADMIQVGVDGVYLDDALVYADTVHVSLPDADGPHTVVVDYYSAAGEVLEFGPVVLTLDRVAPTVVGLTCPAGASGILGPGAAPRFSWSAADDATDVAGYSWVIDRWPGTVPDAATDTVSPSAAVAPLAGGTWFFHVRAVDAAGNWGPAVHLQVQVAIAPSLGRVKVARVGRTTAYRASGSVARAHGGRVTATAYRFNARGRVVAHTTVSASVRGATGATGAYSATMRLKRGSWRVRVSYPGSGVYLAAPAVWSGRFTVR